MIPWLVPTVARAHRPGMSYARVDGGEVTLTFASVDLPTSAEEELEAFGVGLLSEMEMRSEGEHCRASYAGLRREDDAVVILGRLDCDPGAHTLDAAYLTRLGPGHRQYLEVNGQPLAVLDANARTAEWTAASEGVAGVAWRFGELGVHHIWTGYDHLAFLLAVALTASRARDLLFVVTGFTVAHSITLTLGATGLVVLPSALVEAAIAATIVFVGLENLWRPPTRRRIIVTFLLGLVHGFGFAGLLAELGLPREGLAVALLSFNMGVETGQAALVLLGLPLLIAARRSDRWREYAVPALSILIAAAGMYWLIERLWG